MVWTSLRGIRKESSPMKTDVMADVLKGLASTLDKILAKSAVNDLNAVGDCLRRCPGENISTSCNQVIRAKEGGPPVRRGAVSDDTKIALIGGKVQHYLNNQ